MRTSEKSLQKFKHTQTTFQAQFSQQHTHLKCFLQHSHLLIDEPQVVDGLDAVGFYTNALQVHFLGPLKVVLVM